MMISSFLNKNIKFKNTSKHINLILCINSNNNKQHVNNRFYTTTTATIIQENEIIKKNNTTTPFKIKNSSGTSIILGKTTTTTIDKINYVEEFNYPYNDINNNNNNDTSNIGFGDDETITSVVNHKTSFKDKKEVFDETLTISIDEAGKGALLGPLFVSCVVLDSETETYLQSMGVTDSKKLSPKRREYLYDIIIEHALYYQTILLSASDIDQRRELHTLNQIETNLFYQLINDSISNLPVDQQCKIIIDSIEANSEKYSKPFKFQFPPPTYQIHCETKADNKYISVGAASIIAKVERDRWVKQLELQLNQTIGSGYPSDVTTINYVNNYFKSFYIYPDSMRKSWKFTGAEKQPSTTPPQQQVLKEMVNPLQLQIDLSKNINSTTATTLEIDQITNPTIKLSKEEKEIEKQRKQQLKKEKQIEKEMDKEKRLQDKKNRPPTTKQMLELLVTKLNNLEHKIEQIQKKQDQIDEKNSNNNSDNKN